MLWGFRERRGRLGHLAPLVLRAFRASWDCRAQAALLAPQGPRDPRVRLVSPVSWDSPVLVARLVRPVRPAPRDLLVCPVSRVLWACRGLAGQQDPLVRLVRLGRLECLVYPALWVCRALWALPGQPDHLDHLAPLAFQGSPECPASWVCRVRLVRQGQQDLRVQPDPQALLAPQGLLARLGLSDPLARPEHPACRALWDCRELRGRQDPLDPLEQQEQLVRPVPLAPQGRQAHLETLGQQVRPAHLGPLARPVHLAILAPQDLPDQVACPAFLACRVCRERLVPLAHLGRAALQVHPARLALVGQLGLPDRPDPQGHPVPQALRDQLGQLDRLAPLVRPVPRHGS